MNITELISIKHSFPDLWEKSKISNDVLLSNELVEKIENGLLFKLNIATWEQIIWHVLINFVYAMESIEGDVESIEFESLISSAKPERCKLVASILEPTEDEPVILFDISQK